MGPDVLMVFTRFGLTEAVCQILLFSAAQLLQSSTQLSSDLFYALIKDSNYPLHIVQGERVCSQDGAARKQSCF